jgi:hypothetical protein
MIQPDLLSSSEEGSRAMTESMMSMTRFLAS